MRKMKRTFSVAFIILVCLIVFVSLGYQFLCSLSGNGYYETQSLEDYGKYIYTYGVNNYTQEYIERFFPDQIPADFQNVQYRYHSNSVDSYAFEAYLEFTLKDDASFASYVQSITQNKDLVEKTFYFDDTYLEFTLIDKDTGFSYDHIQLGDCYNHESGETYYQIHYADIAKILVKPSERRVIYIALALHDGGGTDTGFLNTYFNRFGIDPKEYEKHVSDVC